MKKNLRIKKNDEISKIIKQKNTVGDKYFVVYQFKNEYEHFRMGLSVSKKYGNAVMRNIAKRRVRNVIMEHQYPKTDMFIVIKPAANQLTFAEIKKDLNRLLKRASLIKE